MEELFANAIGDATTWSQKRSYLKDVTGAKSFPELHPSKWELPVATTYEFSQGPRAAGLDEGLIFDASPEASKGIAREIIQETRQLLGRTAGGGFANPKLPSAMKAGTYRTTLNKRNYVNAILDSVAMSRSLAYMRKRKIKIALAHLALKASRILKEKALTA